MSDSRTRPNAEWLNALRARGSDGARAQAELRELVLRGLAAGLSGKVDASGSLEDFTHEAVLHIMQKLDSFRDESRFSTWALAIAMRVAWSNLRRWRWREVPFESLPDVPQAAEPTATLATQPADPERTIAQREIGSALRVALRSLTERQRRVIIAELRGMPQAELADRLQVSRNALYKLGHDARRAMQRALEAAGFDRDAVQAAYEEP